MYKKTLNILCVQYSKGATGAVMVAFLSSHPAQTFSPGSQIPIAPVPYVPADRIKGECLRSSLPSILGHGAAPLT
jgi:hypothetical protein